MASRRIYFGSPRRKQLKPYATSFSCIVCGARQGEACITISGETVDPHANRIDRVVELFASFR